LVLDGIPRNLSQAELMKDIINVRKIFHLIVPDRTKLITRMKRRAVKENRFDDAKESVIIDRLDTYEALTRPLLDYYGKDLVVEIDALKPPVVVLSEILSQITKDGAGLMPEQQEF